MEEANDRRVRDNGGEQFRGGGVPTVVRERGSGCPRASRRGTILALPERARAARERPLLPASVGRGHVAEASTLQALPAHDDPGRAEQPPRLVDGQLQPVQPEQLLQGQPRDERGQGEGGGQAAEGQKQEPGVERQVAVDEGGEALRGGDGPGRDQQRDNPRRRVDGELEQPVQPEHVLQGQPRGRAGGDWEGVEAEGEEQEPFDGRVEGQVPDVRQGREVVSTVDDASTGAEQHDRRRLVDGVRDAEFGRLLQRQSGHDGGKGEGAFGEGREAEGEEREPFTEEGGQPSEHKGGQ